ncbi:nitroreductase family protein [Desulfovibrio litoralis]|uniref:Nitroreductase n=1 Tax=Desulfovibrio litoralis DSM 11393 TaxID=1121455 RepID=A0A1M7RQH5_9BACT|nr:nitroreductase family protein [Desulfovibrio litoralis]SHN48617.1 Nitroreductase [Desulfovibrio litoralis DSM 11393]
MSNKVNKKMFDNPILKCIAERRSIRRYTDEAISNEQLELILEAGRLTPSGLNNQPWRFLVLHKGDKRLEALAALSKYGHIIKDAKANIAIFLEKDACYNTIKDHQVAGAAMQNMLLAIHSLGLGGVWLGEIINYGDEPVKAMGVNPEPYEFMGLIALGYPDQKGSLERKPLEHFMLEDFRKK